MDNQKVLKQYKVGDYFGERALLTNENRAASVITNTDAAFVKVTREQFVRLLGPVEEILKERMEAYNQYE